MFPLSQDCPRSLWFKYYCTEVLWAAVDGLFFSYVSKKSKAAVLHLSTGAGSSSSSAQSVWDAARSPGLLQTADK